MAKTLERMRSNWERKTANAGDRWKRNTAGADSRLAEGLRALGVSPGPEYMSSWRSGVDSVSASDFQSSIQGKGDKLIRNYVEGVSH